MTVEQIRAKGMREPGDPDFYSDEWDNDPDFDVHRCAERFGIAIQTAYKWRWHVRHQWKLNEQKVTFVPPGGFPAHWHDLTEADMDRLVEDFSDFRVKYFKTPRRQPFWTPDFMQEWVLAILKALVTGGRLIIQSPPRHGKTELMIHTATWLICRWPDIQIVWVGGNERIAQRAVGAVAGHLATNEQLIHDFAGPHGSFKPKPKDALPWSKSEFTVVTRTQAEKGRTMTALGRGGTLLSVDASLLVVDDAEDHGSTVMAASRESTREWFVSQLESRKVEETALVVIGSRQHVDDLAGHLLDNPEYQSLVESAHDPTCDIPETPDQYDAHTECMLFDQLRSFRWFKQQQQAAETTGGLRIFNQVYQNIVTGDGMSVFNKEDVLACRNPNWAIGRFPGAADGVDPRGSAVRLVAGLDPSRVSFQASVLLAFVVQPELKVWVVDVDNHLGGGVAPAFKIIRDWFEKYKVHHWVVESNLHQGLLTQDRDIRDYALTHDIRLEDAWTGLDKGSTMFGVSALAPLFTQRQIILPGDPNSLPTIKPLIEQFCLWDGSTTNRNARGGTKDDIVMATWLAWQVIRRARQEHNAEMGVSYDGGYRTSNWDTPPWDGFDTAPWARSGY